MFRRYLSKFWKLNKGKIYAVAKVLSIVFIVLFLVMGFLSSMQNMDYILPETSSTYTPTYTITTGDTVNQKDYEEDSNIVDNFIELCNNGDIENAYNLLSEECKRELYPSIDEFRENYVTKYFSNKKQYNLQSWANVDDYNIYKIRILDDLLTTGNYDESKRYEDYITVFNDKININGYIKEKKIGKESESNGIKIYVDKVNMYIDYEIYTITVTNNTENDILLDSLKTGGRSLSLVSKNNYNYPVLNSRYLDFLVDANTNKNIELKFNKKYTSSEYLVYMYFSQIVMNYSEFMSNKTEYNDIIELKVDLGYEL